MHAPLIYEAMADLRCAERQQRSLHNWHVAQALAETSHPARLPRIPLLRRIALLTARRLTRLAGADGGLYTVQGKATLVDARGVTRTVCLEENYVVLLPRTDRNAA